MQALRQLGNLYSLVLAIFSTYFHVYFLCLCFMSLGDLESALSDAQQLRSERDATKRALSKLDQDFLAEQARS